jgi:hypothetical protein
MCYEKVPKQSKRCICYEKVTKQSKRCICYEKVPKQSKRCMCYEKVPKQSKRCMCYEKVPKQSKRCMCYEKVPLPSLFFLIKMRYNKTLWNKSIIKHTILMTYSKHSHGLQQTVIEDVSYNIVMEVSNELNKFIDF